MIITATKCTIPASAFGLLDLGDLVARGDSPTLYAKSSFSVDRVHCPIGTSLRLIRKTDRFYQFEIELPKDNR